MQHDIVNIFVIGLLTWGIWALNERCNGVPNVKPALSIIIIMVGCLFLITPVVDVITIALNSVHK